MKYLVTACLLSERLKPRPKPGVREFFERSQIVIPFATHLTIQRGIGALAERDPGKARILEDQIDALMAGCETLVGDDLEIARAMARILGHGPLRHTWLPNDRAKLPTYGHYPWVAAASLATGIPIASVKLQDLAVVSSYFELPGVFDPVERSWVRLRPAAWVASGETPPEGGVSR